MAGRTFIIASFAFLSLCLVSLVVSKDQLKEKLSVYQYDKETNSYSFLANESTPDISNFQYDITNSIIPIINKESQDPEDFPDSMDVTCKSDFKGASCGTFSLVGCTRYKRFYAESSLKMDWFDSYELCRSHGMILASIESRYEQHILETYLIEKDIREDSSLKPYWTSGTDFGRGNSYMWLATGKDFSSSFNYFLNDEKALHGIDGVRKDPGCVQLMISSDSSTSDYWDVKDCSSLGFTLCQM